MNLFIKIKYLFVFLIVGFFVFNSIAFSQLAAVSNLEEDDYRVIFNSEDILMNITKIMARGAITEYNITITGSNSSLTLIAEIIPPAGRLWGVYIENSSYYYSSKETETYAGFSKLMDHVSNYTVKHVSKSPGDYVLGLHNSHLHDENDTNFNLLVLNGTFGEETTIIADQTHEPTPTTPASIFAFSISLFSLVLEFKKRNKKI